MPFLQCSRSSFRSAVTGANESVAAGVCFFGRGQRVHARRRPRASGFRMRSPESILAERSGAATRGRERRHEPRRFPCICFAPRSDRQPGKAERRRGGGRRDERERISPAPRVSKPPSHRCLSAVSRTHLCTFPTEGTRQSAFVDGSRLRLSSDRAGGCRSGRASSSGVSLARQEALHETQRGGRARAGRHEAERTNAGQPLRAFFSPVTIRPHDHDSFRYFELSLQSPFHHSIALLVRYRSHTGIRPREGFTSRFALHAERVILARASFCRR
jgi:hypothetical protein